MFKQFSDRISKVPITLPVMTSALTSYTKGPLAIVFNAEDPLKASIYKQLLPLGSALIGIPKTKEHAETAAKLFPFVKTALSKGMEHGKILVFRGQNSPKEISSLDDLEKLWV